MRARITRISEALSSDVELDALGTSLRESTREVLTLMPNLPKETAGILDNVREPGALADLIASNVPQEHASVGDKFDDGTMINTGARKQTLRLNLDQTLASKLTSQVSATFLRTFAQRGISNNDKPADQPKNDAEILAITQYLFARSKPPAGFVDPPAKGDPAKGK